MVPYLSVVIPVFNEAQNLNHLQEALTPVLQTMGKPYEVIYIDDGSTDQSLEILRQLQTKDKHLAIIKLSRNSGQHAAIFAGLDQSAGDIVVTLDADLQNPPEAIPSLVRAIETGHDVVGGWRESRQDSFFRRTASTLMNRLVSWRIGVRIHDIGCMLRAYRREIVKQICQYPKGPNFIPALAYLFARTPLEIEVPHRSRAQGRSKYSLRGLLRLNALLMRSLSNHG